MSTTAPGPGGLAGTRSQRLEATGSLGSYRLMVYAGCVIAALVTNYVRGKDLAWDTLDYHLYAGFSALHDRFGRDYFAAGPQGYFNPYLYVPFYALVRSGLSALQIGSILAVFQSAVLWLSFELGVLVSPWEERGKRLVVGLGAVALAFANPILLQQLGSSYGDVTTTVLVLAGWLLLARSVRSPQFRLLAGAGLILGVAAALKLTNAVHAAAGFVVLALLPTALRGKLRGALTYGAGLAGGFAVVTAPWAYRLEQHFGNPLFPLFNNVFRSPQFTTSPLLTYRFIPGSLMAALWRPFALVNPVYMVQEELRAPDVRYAVLLLLLVALLIRWMGKRLTRLGQASSHRGPVGADRMLAALVLGFAADWAMWLVAAGNGRYFIPMACVAAVLVIALMCRLLPTQTKARNYALLVIFLVQGLQLWMGTDYNWRNRVPWTQHAWFDVSIPKKLSIQPSLYLSLGAQSSSYLLPFLAPGSGFINLSGGYDLPATGANGAHVRALIDRHMPHVRMLEMGLRLYPDDALRGPRESVVNETLAPFGLKVDMSDCARMALHGLRPYLMTTFVQSRPIPRLPPNTTYYVSCRVVAAHVDLADRMARQRRVDRIFDHIEAACPQIFQPRGLVSVQDGYSWERHYINTDVVAWVSHGAVKFRDMIHGGPMVYLGRATQWEKGVVPVSCGRAGDGHYYARLRPDVGRGKRS